MAKNKVDITGINTSEIKVISSKEMIKLFERFKGGENIREEIVNCNLKLVLSILKKFTFRNENMDDLFQVGCIGLLKAIDNFDLSHGVMFSTYAVPMILGEVKRYLRDNSALRISRSIKDTAYKTIKLKEELISKNGVEPQLSEIAEILELPIYDVVLAMDALKDPVSIFEPVFSEHGDNIYLFDQIEDKKDKAVDWDIKIALDKAIDNLKDREKFILNERFITGKTQMEIAEEIGISQAQVSRLEKNSLNHVKKLIK